LFLLRLIIGVMFAVGGWQTAVGLRRGDDATAWQGMGLIAVGLEVEVVRNWWRSRRLAPIAEGNVINPVPHSWPTISNKSEIP